MRVIMSVNAKGGCCYFEVFNVVLSTLRILKEFTERDLYDPLQ